MKRYILALLVSGSVMANIDKLQEDVATKRHSIHKAKLQYFIAKKTLELENMKIDGYKPNPWAFWKSRSINKALWAVGGAAFVLAIRKI